MIAVSLEGAHLGSLRCRDDVLLCHSTSDAGHSIIVFRVKPLSTPSSALVKQSVAATLDAVGGVARQQ